MDPTVIVPFSYTPIEETDNSLNKENKVNKSISSPVKKRQRRKGTPIQLYLSDAILSALDNVVQMNGTSRSDWIRQAILRSLKNWKNPLENPTLWGSCRHCGHRHDPKVHG